MTPAPVLPKSYQSRFCFAVAATSFIYPGLWSVNAERLGPFVDEIELLLFESCPSSLPDNGEIAALCGCAAAHGHRYNVHLPIDLHLGSPDRRQRRQNAERMAGVLSLVKPLGVTTHTLHLDDPPETGDAGDRSRWLSALGDSLALLQDRGTPLSSISVETLMYPFHWIHPLLERFPLTVCLDLGHLIRRGRPLWDAFLKYEGKTSIIHLHGADIQTDHQPLDFLSKDHLKTVLRILSRFGGTVSLEVFRFDDLADSLVLLDRLLPVRTDDEEQR